MSHANGSAMATGVNAQEVPDRLLALTTEALAFISRERAEGMARQWLAGVPIWNSSEQSMLARIYRSIHSSRRRSATNSFQVGLARGIIRKLDTLRQARNVAGGSTNGRALVPIKESIIDEEMDRLGLNFRRRSAVRRMVLPAAFSAGQKAGERFEYRPGIERG